MRSLQDDALDRLEMIVRDFLDALQTRRVEQAQQYLAPGAVMMFPGSETMTSLRQVVDWAQGRYRSVTKSIDKIESFKGANDTAILYVIGTLAGVWPDGKPFHGVRFIDRFELSGRQIIRQDVWNDLAERRRV